MYTSEKKKRNITKSTTNHDKSEKKIKKKIKIITNKTRILQAIRDTKKKKTPGPDKIINEMIKAAPPHIIDLLKDLYENCILQRYIPKIWQKTTGAVLQKPGKKDYSKPKSYRIITLSSNLLKILEKLVLWYMQKDLKLDKKMKKSQFGFRAGLSTDTATFNLMTKVELSLKQNHHALGVFLDIEGAFDSIPHTTIKKTLDKTEAKGMVSNWIQYMVQNRFI